MYYFFFFFSSRRRHTRFKCDWSSDVCSSDLELGDFAARLDPRGMDGISRIRRKTFFAVFDVGVQFAGNVLVESAAEADVQALAAIAYGENRFPRGEGVLENCEIGFFPVRIGVVRLFVT